eukprot:264682-Rhodomonas_salina.1
MLPSSPFSTRPHHHQALLSLPPTLLTSLAVLRTFDVNKNVSTCSAARENVCVFSVAADRRNVSMYSVALLQLRKRKRGSLFTVPFHSSSRSVTPEKRWK